MGGGGTLSLLTTAAALLVLDAVGPGTSSPRQGDDATSYGSISISGRSTGGIDGKPTTVSLASATVTLIANRTNGRIVALLDAHTNRSFVQANAAPLFTVQLVEPHTRGQVTLLSDEFRTIAFRVAATADDGGNAVVLITFSDHPLVAGLTVSVSIAETDAVSFGGLHFGLSIAGLSSALAPYRIAYPGFSMAAILPGHEGETGGLCRSNSSDELVLPFSEGVVVPCPGWATQTAGEQLYPGGSPFQFSSRSDARSGLYFAHHDGGGHVKAWQFSSLLKEKVLLPMLHLMPETTNLTEISIPYPVAVAGFGRGGWRTAAGIYKMWARTQTWCATKLVDRADIPRVLVNGSAGFVVGIQTAQGFDPNVIGAHLEDLPNLTAQYKQLTGVDSSFVVCAASV